jgi:multimeric flavodoxin WrbA
MTNNVLILLGSPRTRGNTACLAARLAEGARQAGAEVETVYLHELDIRACDACDLCKETGVDCAIEDDMQSIYPKLRSADALVLASPVYWFTYSAQLKLCIDRMYGLFQNERHLFDGRQVGMLLVYGDDDLYLSGGINAIHTVETTCRYLGANFAGLVHGSVSDPGDAEKRPDLLEGAYRLGVKLGTGDSR